MEGEKLGQVVISAEVAAEGEDVWIEAWIKPEDWEEGGKVKIY